MYYQIQLVYGTVRKYLVVKEAKNAGKSKPAYWTSEEESGSKISDIKVAQSLIDSLLDAEGPSCDADGRVPDALRICGLGLKGSGKKVKGYLEILCDNDGLRERIESHPYSDQRFFKIQKSENVFKHAAHAA